MTHIKGSINNGNNVNIELREALILFNWPIDNATIDPKYTLPESPIKNFAGLQLKYKNMLNITEKININELLFKPKNKKNIKLEPAIMPSSPSKKLKKFIIAVIRINKNTKTANPKKLLSKINKFILVFIIKK